MKLKFIFISILLGCSLTWAYSLQYHPLLLKVSDKKGKTLIKALDDVYGDKIQVRDGRCYFFEKQSRGADLEYEIDKCNMDFNQQKIYSQADRLNGIEIKGTIWIEGNSYRTRPYNGEWSEWKSTELISGVHWVNRTGFHFEKRNGEFQFKPTPGIKNIRGTSGYVSESKTKAIQNGEEAGIIIQESGSGKIVIQESR